MIYGSLFFRLFFNQYHLSRTQAVPDQADEAKEKPYTAPEVHPQYSEVSEHELAMFAQHISLTEREKELFSLMKNGMSNQQICDNLHISISTVKTHMHNIYQKAGVTHRYELLRIYEQFISDLQSSSRQIG